MFTYSVSFSDGVKLTETSEREYTHAWAARDAFGTVAACGLANSTTGNLEKLLRSLDFESIPVYD